MIQLEPTSSAPWAKNGLASEASELKKKANAARRRGAQHLPIKNAADFVATVFERAARVLEEGLREINPPPP